MNFDAEVENLVGELAEIDEINEESPVNEQHNLASAVRKKRSNTRDGKTAERTRDSDRQARESTTNTTTSKTRDEGNGHVNSTDNFVLVSGRHTQTKMNCVT